MLFVPYLVRRNENKGSTIIPPHGFPHILRSSQGCRSSPQLYPLLLESRKTQCESSEDPSSKPSKHDAIYAEISPDNPYKDDIVELRRELEEPCQACLYTGVSVCLGLSLYFLKLATEETTLPKNRQFLYMCSAGSIVAGAYRCYLG